jgi:hypothetical protein
MEMTLSNLKANRSLDHQDVLPRAELLCALDKTVMIPNYTRFDCVTAYLRRHTKGWIGFVVGLPTLRASFDEQY